MNTAFFYSTLDFGRIGSLLILSFFMLQISFAHSQDRRFVKLMEVPEYREAFQRMAADRQDKQAAYDFALVAVDKRDYSGAIGALEAILRLDPSRDNIRADLGALYLQVNNPVTALNYLKEARQRGDKPEAIKADIDDLVDAAESAIGGHELNISMIIGGRYETNAVGGPADIPNLISGAEEEDSGVSALTEIDYSYDLGLQGGHTFDVNTDVFFVEYSKEISPSIFFTGIEAGPTIYISESTSFSPFLDVSTLRLRHRRYREHFGGGIEFDQVVDSNLRLDAEVSAAYEDFTDSFENPRSEEQTGPIIEGVLSIDWVPIPTITVSASAFGAIKEATEDFESYDKFGLDLQAVWRPTVRTLYESPRSVSFGVGGSFSKFSFSAPDPQFSPTSNRSDDRLLVRAFFGVPVIGDTEVVGSVGFQNNESNIPLQEFDNLFFFFGIKTAFHDLL